MRCEQCAKFVSYGEGTVELNVGDQEGGQISVGIRAVLPCDECASELKDNSFEWEISLAEHFDLTLKPEYGWGDTVIGDKKFHAIRAHSPEAGWFVLFYEWKQEEQKDTRPSWERRNEPWAPTYVSVLKYLDRKPAATEAACDDLLHEFVMTEFNETRFEVTNEEAEFTSRYEGSGRYQKTFYGADVIVTVKDVPTGVEHTFEKHVEESASLFSEL